MLINETVEFQDATTVLQYMQDLGVVTRHQQKIVCVNEKLITYFCSLLWPFIDSYYVSLGFLYNLIPQQKQELIESTQYFAEALYFERVIEHYECTSRETIKNALKLFKVS